MGSNMEKPPCLRACKPTTKPITANSGHINSPSGIFTGGNPSPARRPGNHLTAGAAPILAGHLYSDNRAK